MKVLSNPERTDNNLLQGIKKFVKNIYREKSKEFNYLYHNWEHSENVMKEAIRIAKYCGLNDLKIENIAIAALFHDVGYEKGLEHHEKRGAEIAEKYLQSKNLSQNRIDSIKKLILATKVFTIPDSIEEMVIKDADLCHLGKPYFFRNYYNLQEELNSVFKLNIKDKEWCESTIDFLNKQEYYTSFAKKNYHPLKMQNLKQLIRMRESGACGI